MPVSDCPISGAELRRLTPADAGQVTVLQRACWVEEALTNEDWWIPALRETVDEVAQWLGELEGWGLWLDKRLVAMVRAGRTDDTWDVGRLAVVPDLRGNHLGDWLMDHIESRAAEGCTRFELFTGARSERNISRYERRGYHLIGEWRPGVVLLEKPITR